MKNESAAIGANKKKSIQILKTQILTRILFVTQSLLGFRSLRG